MSDKTFDPQDARLTAFVLGELDEAERLAIAQQIERCPETRAAVDEIRETVGQITAALQSEPAPTLSAAQRSTITEALTTPLAVQRTEKAPVVGRSGRLENIPALLAGVTVVAAAVFLLVLPPFHHDPANDASPALAVTERDDRSLHDPSFYERIGVDFDFNVQDTVTESLVTAASPGNGVKTGDATGPESFRAVSDGESNTLLLREKVPTTRPAVNVAGGNAIEPGMQTNLESFANNSTRFSATFGTGTTGRPMSSSASLANQGQSTFGRPQDTESLRQANNLPQQRQSVLRDYDNSIRSYKRLVVSSGQTSKLFRNSTTPLGGEASDRKSYGYYDPSGQNGRRGSLAPPTTKPQIPGKGSPAYPAVVGRSKLQISGAGIFERGGQGQDGEQTVAPAEKPILSVIQLKTVDVADAAKKISTALPGIVVNQDGRNKRLHIVATAEQQQQLAAVVTKIDKPATVHRVRELREQLGWADGIEAPGSEQYEPIVENPLLSPFNDPLSTFSIDVDTASYSNVRRFLKQNQWPPAGAVRIEEMLNYFSYDYPQPEEDRPFAVNLEAGPCPWNSNHRLIRIGLKGKEIDKSARPPSNLVFLLDVSGSMRDANKLPLVKSAMELLTGEMTEDDRVAIVTYAGKAGLTLESTSGQDKTRIIDAIHALSAGGSTNGEAGIKLAYEKAVEHFIDDGTNRVIVCTDGDFNVGNSADDEMVKLIQDKAKSKVFLSVFGFGMGNIKDGKLEKIADKGNGQYGYIDDIAEARKVFVEEMVGTLYTIAKDVKIQVEFNPQQVGGYRLIGYENRMLEAPDFADDTKDAGEIGAGHTVTALYEIVPADKLPAGRPLENLKYQKSVKPAADDPLSKELLTLKLRYKQPDGEKSVKIDYTLTDDGPRTVMPSVDFEWASAVAGFGLLLRNSQYRGQADFDLVRELAMGSKGEDESGHRREFLDLVYRAHVMSARQQGQPIPPRESLPEDKARELARAKGRYSNLLKRISVPSDAETYGNFTDYGYWAGASWAGHENLPTGHWVYVAPHWYIWGEETEQPQPKPESKEKGSDEEKSNEQPSANEDSSEKE